METKTIETPQTLEEFQRIVALHIPSAASHVSTDFFSEEHDRFIYEGPKNIIRFLPSQQRFRGGWVVSRQDLDGNLRGFSLAEALYGDFC